MARSKPSTRAAPLMAPPPAPAEEQRKPFWQFFFLYPALLVALIGVTPTCWDVPVVAVQRRERQVELGHQAERAVAQEHGMLHVTRAI